MATRTSTQSGNFNSTSTWGGNAVPVDGDAFVVSAGHIVTVSDDRRTTNGYDNSTINGKLHITGSGKLRMNGQLDVTSTGTSDYFTENDSTTGAYFRMENGARLEIKGDNGANHSLRFNNQKYNWLEVEGTNPNQTTTMASAASIGSTSLSFTSGTGFAAGDWISVYRSFENCDDWEYDRFMDEGMIVHDVSGNTIYPRWFVGPCEEITRVSGSKIFVEDASVFRVGQKIIFGTGSNRNIKTITDIGKNANRITCDSAISGSVVGEKVYKTGTEIYHNSGDDVQKIATPILVDVSSGTRTIQVASTAGMAVGQRVLIEANNPDDTNWDYEMMYEIESIPNSTSIVVTNNLANDRKKGGWVTIFERDTVISAVTVEADGQASSSEDRPYIYHTRWTSGDAYYRRVRYRNCLFDGIGSNSTNTTWYRGVGVNGYFSYENTSYGQYASGMEGCSWQPNNRGNNACMYMRDGHQVPRRRNVCYNGTLNFWRYSSNNNYNENNNISWRGSYVVGSFDSIYEPRSTICYNHFGRSDDYGVMMHHFRVGSSQFRHNYIVFNEQRPMYMYYFHHNSILENNYIEYFRSWPFIGTGGDINFVNSYINNPWDATTGNTSPVNGVRIQQDGNNRSDRMGAPQKVTSVNHQWKEGATAQWATYCWRIWDDDESAWKVFRDTDTTGPGGFMQMVFVPAGSTVYTAAEIKLSSGFSGTYPYLFAKQANSYHNGRHYDGSTTAEQLPATTADSYVYGFAEYEQFTASAVGAYERKTETIEPVNYDYFLQVGVYTGSTNAGDGLEHWFEKPIEIYIDKPSNVKEKKTVMPRQSKFGQNNSSTRKRKRLGGRIK